MSPTELLAARRTVLNAHYTDPRVVEAIWTAVKRLGFAGGPVLEPGCGAGTFIGLAPENAAMIGVELDPITADIARHLYPSATIRTESFADTHLPWGGIEAVVGNVPFGEVVLHDRLHNSQRHSIHNHFILKSLNVVRPGGMVAVLTSRYTLDAVKATARRAMYEQADLVTALRLPTGSHRSAAGTEAVIDLVILRKRLPDEPPGDPSWLHTAPVAVPVRDPADGDPTSFDLPLNAWWDQHPELLLGTLSAVHGMHGARTLGVEGAWGREEAARFRALLLNEADKAVVHGKGASAPTREDVASRFTPAAQSASHDVVEHGDARSFEGFLTWDAEAGHLTRLTLGTREPVEISKAAQRPVRMLLELRSTVLALLEAEAATAAPAKDQGSEPQEIRDLRATLNDQYDTYVARYGPINHVTVSTLNKRDKQGRPIIQRRKPAAMRVFDQDPFSAAVRGLEIYDEQTGTAQKADIMRRRVAHRVTIPTAADDPGDALALCLESLGRVDLERIAELLETTPEDARIQLGERVFADPADDGRLVTRAEYLSGNVRRALHIAESAAPNQPELWTNVAALREVIPTDLSPAEIKAQLGASWIPANDVRQFIEETLNDTSVTVDHVGGAQWAVRGGNRGAVAATQEWGTERMNAHVIIGRLLEQRPIWVHDTYVDQDGHEKRVINPDETEAAQDKARELQERFGEWVWNDPDRAQRLAAVYNQTFNAFALRDYSADGSRLRLPGLAATFTPHPHQRAAVARILAEPSVGLFHEVGAGKTATMVMGAMELRRLGMVAKPAVIVPNHMLEQFTREWMQLYPRARLLAASSEALRGDGRTRFVGRAVMGDWDAVLMTQGAFQQISVSKHTEVTYIEEELSRLRGALERARDAGATRMTVRQMEKACIREEERLKAKLDQPRDPGLTFEQTGIDYLMVDELHLFKNLTIASNIPGVSIDGSRRATDLDMKVSWLRSEAQARAADTGRPARVITGATATPIANSVSEAWVMQHYLRPDILQAAGVDDFDAWAGTFGTVVTELEIVPEGGHRQKTRFARFDNLPELLRMWHISADVQTAEDLDLPVPRLVAQDSGERAPQTVVVPASPELRVYMEKIHERAEEVRAGRGGGKGEDNLLVISSDGRKAALDMRMLSSDYLLNEPSSPSKADVLTDLIAERWQRHRNTNYAIPETGEVHPQPGALQIVFADLGTPNPDRHWSFYEQLRDNLVARGLDHDRVRFVQEASTDRKKSALFAACRNGEVDVLVGSTETMGVGTNVQTRAVALYHVDCPWRPADMAQREGRILRQGNQNPEVEIIRLVTGNSFDGFSWQTVERKQRFIAQMLHGTLEARGAEDLSSSDSKALSYAQVKAVVSGSPLLLERAQVEQDVARLESLARAHSRNQQHRHTTIESMNTLERDARNQLARLRKSLRSRRPTQGDQFNAIINDCVHHDRGVAARALSTQLRSSITNTGGMLQTRGTPAGSVTIGGVTFDLYAYRSLGTSLVEAHIPGTGHRGTINLDQNDVLDSSSGPLTRLENFVARLESVIEGAERDISTAQSERTAAEAGLDQPFPRAADLADARARLAHIDRQLAAEAHPVSHSVAKGEPEDHEGPAEPSRTSRARKQGHEEDPPGAGSSNRAPRI